MVFLTSPSRTAVPAVQMKTRSANTKVTIAQIMNAILTPELLTPNMGRMPRTMVASAMIMVRRGMTFQNVYASSTLWPSYLLPMKSSPEIASVVYLRPHPPSVWNFVIARKNPMKARSAPTMAMRLKIEIDPFPTFMSPILKPSGCKACMHASLLTELRL